ncbi:hypothetical protein BaRGS_00011920 [Batillaria attramentaria]|uniref:Uncharacterized protein n=1 Tax=Batillaria attramentaria TaxID=370345 RepID=A0ABD0LC37_9CAEN
MRETATSLSMHAVTFDVLADDKSRITCCADETMSRIRGRMRESIHGFGKFCCGRVANHQQLTLAEADEVNPGYIRAIAVPRLQAA